MCTSFDGIVPETRKRFYHSVIDLMLKVILKHYQLEELRADLPETIFLMFLIIFFIAFYCCSL